ncbi:hypothetical protein [Streptomyces sp. NPDC006691]|uniref:hypothetical protein n=1 Tax=Streptomyces sp. NPDC006691 TaxID=3364757 RepID=UPI0036780BCB
MTSLEEAPAADPAHTAVLEAAGVVRRDGKTGREEVIAPCVAARSRLLQHGFLNMALAWPSSMRQAVAAACGESATELCAVAIAGPVGPAQEIAVIHGAVQQRASRIVKVEMRLPAPGIGPLPHRLRHPEVSRPHPVRHLIDRAALN